MVMASGHGEWGSSLVPNVPRPFFSMGLGLITNYELRMTNGHPFKYDGFTWFGIQKAWSTGRRAQSLRHGKDSKIRKSEVRSRRSEVGGRMSEVGSQK